MAATSAQVDRQTTTPFLLKLFYREGSFPALSELHDDPLPPNLDLYTWPTCTLRELTHLLALALPELFPQPTSLGTRLTFRLAYPDTRPAGLSSSTSTTFNTSQFAASASNNTPDRFLSRDLGSVVIGDGHGVLPLDDDEAKLVAGGPVAGRAGGEPGLMLRDARFVIGDYILVAVGRPASEGDMAPPLVGLQPLQQSEGGYRGGYGGMGRGGRGGDYHHGRGEYHGGYRERDRDDGVGGGGGGGGGYGGSGGYGGGYRGRGGRGGGGGGGWGGGPQGMGGRGPALPSGEWRRGERLPDGPPDVGGRGGRGGYGSGGRGRDRW